MIPSYSLADGEFKIFIELVYAFIYNSANIKKIVVICFHTHIFKELEN